jgi:hypothetical protein
MPDELKHIVDECLQAMADGRCEPYAGARELWRRAPDPDDHPRRYQQQAPFIGLLAAWGDEEPRRAASIERAIVEEAQALVAAGGLVDPPA